MYHSGFHLTPQSKFMIRKIKKLGNNHLTSKFIRILTIGLVVGNYKIIPSDTDSKHLVFFKMIFILRSMILLGLLNSTL